MDLFDVARSCIRRWWVVLPVLAAAAWFAHHVYATVKPVYYSYAVISLTPPSTRVDVRPDGSPVPRNGLLDVGGAGLIANLTAIGMRDPSVVAQVVAAGGQPDYSARMFPVPPNSPQLPMLMIDTTQPDPASASKTVELVVAQADPTLRALQQQADVPDDQMVKPFTVSPPSVPTGAVPSRTRSTVAIALAGAGIAILLGVIVDVVLMRFKAGRQRRRQARVQTPDAAAPPNAVAPPAAAGPSHEAARAHERVDAPRDGVPWSDPAAHEVHPTQEDARGHPADLTHGADPAGGLHPHGVDPAEVYSRNKHAAADEVRTDSR